MEHNTTYLRQVLTQRFSSDELCTLCFDLGLDYDFLPGEGKGGKARELLRYISRRGRLNELVEVGQELRPDIKWRDETPLLPNPPIPHNLPPRNDFIGREAEKKRVYEALQSRSYLVSIDGIGGIGKTSLALEVAYECLHASRETKTPNGKSTFAGFIWATAKDRDLTQNHLLDAVARTLNYPGIAQRPLEEKREAVKRLLRERPYLLLVDNLETVTDEGIRDFLLKLPEPSKALITTREQTLRRVWAVSLKGLEKNEALALIRKSGRRLGLPALAEAKDVILLRLYRATGGAPLAIKWAVGQIKQRGQSLDSVLAALHEARGDVFKEVFVRSWNLLSSNAQKVLTVMSSFATSASHHVIEAASDVHHFELDEALGELVEMSLLECIDEFERGTSRYSIHPLTRFFAQSQSVQDQEAEAAIYERLLELYRKFTYKHGGFWNRQGFKSLEPELPNILKTVKSNYRIAVRESDEELAIASMKTFYSVSDFMIIRGAWNDALAVAELSISTARELNNQYYEAAFRVWPIGWIQRHRGKLEESENNTRWAIAALNDKQPQRDLIYAKRNLGRILQEKGELDEAERLIREVLAFYISTEDKRQIYFVTANLADVLLQKGEEKQAWELCANILPSVRNFNDPERIAGVLSVLAKIETQKQNHEKAQLLWEEALTNMRRADRLDGIADCLLELARLEDNAGNKLESQNMLMEALDSYQRLDMASKVSEIKLLLRKLMELSPMGSDIPNDAR